MSIWFLPINITTGVGPILFGLSGLYCSCEINSPPLLCSSVLDKFTDLGVFFFGFPN
ncbi:hypothetical protein TNCV_363931 [Trichonephila clavipes]|uniref:Uncharacterized protein n=1 Tax=Trichonephila clavipes TaxID=2585209 RepID=A0A8X6SRJ0_TRICX|nr:hypothetical protein TNCV_363931 [Trichonephila clavipes]